MKKQKQLLLFLSTLFVCLSFSTTAIASEHLYTDSNGLTWRFELKNGEATLISDNDEDGTWEICVTGDHIPATLIVPSRVKVGSVEYPVVAIGWDAFAYGWLSSTSIVLPESVTRIEENAFYEATNLKRIYIPSSVTSISCGAFEWCDNLEIAEFGSIESLCNIEFGFYSMSQGEYTYEANPLTYAHHLYIDGEEVTNVVIPRSITTIKRGVFWGCNNITSVFIPATVTSIDHWAFSNGPRTFTVNWQTPISVPSDAFQYGYGVGIPDGSTLYIPHGTRTAYEAAEYWKDFNIIEMDEPSPDIVFADDAVKAICVSNWDTNGDGELNEDEAASVTEIGSVFNGNRDITSFDELQYFTGLEEIAAHAFKNCNRLTSINIPVNITAIGGGAFYGCTSLEKAYFASIESLCSMDFQYSIISGETYSSNPMFYAEDLYVDGVLLSGDVVIPEGVESIGAAAFYKCREITSVNIPSSVRTIGQYAFYLCTSLSAVNLPGIRQIESHTFYGCPFASIFIPSSVTWIRDYAFCSCRSLNNIEWSENLEYIDDAAFNLCQNLSSVVLPKKVKSIGDSAFDGCSSLESITIPNTVTYIGPAAFYGCSNLTSMYVYWENPITITYPDVFSYRTNATLYVPVGLQAAYEVASFWKDFKNIVEMQDDVTVGSTGYATYCSSHELDFTDVCGLKAYIASGFEPSTGTLVLTRALKVPAGEGLYLVGDAGTYEVPFTTTDMVYSNLLKGVTTATTISPTDGGNTNFILANGSHGVGFYTLSEAGELAAGKAYLQLPTASLPSGVKAISVIFDDDDATGITSPLGETREGAAIYNLQGQKVNAPKSGLYVINGKKVFVK